MQGPEDYNVKGYKHNSKCNRASAFLSRHPHRRQRVDFPPIQGQGPDARISSVRELSATNSRADRSQEVAIRKRSSCSASGHGKPGTARGRPRDTRCESMPE